MFNAAAYFVDRHIEEGRTGSTAIECGDRRLSYRDLFDQVNRVGNAVKMALDVRRDSSARVIIISAELVDAPAPAIETCTSLRHVVVLGQDVAGRLAGAMSFEALVDAASPALEPEPTSGDAQAFWLYSS